MEHIVSSISADMFRIIGVIGSLTYVASYASLSFRLISSESIVYYVLNTSAASMVMISLAQDFNLASAMIQFFWIAIGLSAIALRLADRHRKSRAAV